MTRRLLDYGESALLVECTDLADTLALKAGLEAEPMPQVAPLPGEVVVTKQYASGFFGTTLASTLTSLGVDTLVVVGVSTSGCIRATALDALQSGFRPVVVRDAVGDRSAAPHEANLFDLQAKYADVLELTLYNAVLAGVSLDGKRFFYTNTLRQLDTMPAPLRWSRSREEWISCYCCPPNVARTVAQASGYAYGRSERGLWVHLYGGSTLDTTLADGRRAKLKQATASPSSMPEPPWPMVASWPAVGVCWRLPPSAAVWQRRGIEPIARSAGSRSLTASAAATSDGENWSGSYESNGDPGARHSHSDRRHVGVARAPGDR